MFKQMIRISAIGTVLAAAVMATGAVAPATAASTFGEHVSSCAQTVGFNADHHPGMHQGRHGWAPSRSC